MDVILYVYDLSKLSRPLTGVQIDAIYHTSIVLDGTEYFFGRGIQQAVPGSTHHGQPMETINLGCTDLPLDVISEYMESLAETYHESSYDLFLRNCNNFTHDLATFLVGKGIPDHIRNLPETFLNTPFGQMMKPYIDGMLRGATQGPDIQPVSASVPARSAVAEKNLAQQPPKGQVRNVSTLREVESLLASAKSSCAVIFFTSATCPPCKIVYPTYDELAEEAGSKAVLIKVDISRAYDVSSHYQVRATPTFITYLKGEKENQWSGANPAELRGNVQLLLRMAWPPHPHSSLKLPSLERHIDQYISYKKVPPLDKLLSKAGAAASDANIVALVNFIKASSADQSKPPLPDLSQVTFFVKTKFLSLPAETHFAILDLFRVAFVDPRVSGYFAEEHGHGTILTLLSRANDLADIPYSQQLIMTHLACNLFTSHLYLAQLSSHDALRHTCIKLATNALLDHRSSLRATGTSLIFNLAAANHNKRLLDPPEAESLPEADQFELVASVVEAIRAEQESPETLHGLLLSLGLLLHHAPVGGEVVELCRALEVESIISEKTALDAFKKEKALLQEIGQELVGKGLSLN
ncbi:Desumoylating isopeptidase [Trichophyton interdigitale]|nr:Desumoylating isopeptidase [Trichophyton interdigitale]KAG5218305.1 Desumoylating isopeptidase [Trichophyton interdigitale]KAG8206718.1 Desumoylating isopeptidase [Trichophyton interdigitale]